ncbi:MAG: tRNA sulfurtransferase [Haloarculaceae archaeon]
MRPSDADTVLVRHGGEIGVKSDQVRRKMEHRLRANLRALLDAAGVDAAISQERHRTYLTTDAPAAATAAAADCFGVASASAARRVDPTLDAIRDALAETARERYGGGPFAVRARRAGPEGAHSFSSRDIEQRGGAAAWNAIEDAGGDPVVDLEDPDLELFVECRPADAYVFLEKRAGPGGLPVGTQRPVVALISGGIDSPVAAWETMRRGAPIVPVYVDLGEYGGVDHRARAESTVETLAAYAPTLDTDLRVVEAGDLVADLVESVEATRMLSLRRAMLAMAEAIAERVGAVGVATGEAIGQKSSQTSANLAVTDAAVDLPVHRPNLTRDKAEITERAREIGTYDESTIPAGCNRVAPAYPETSATLEQVRAAEPDDLLERARALAAATTGA